MAPSLPGPSQQQAGPSLPSCSSLNLHTRVRGRDGLRGCVETSLAGKSVLRCSLCPHVPPPLRYRGAFRQLAPAWSWGTCPPREEESLGVGILGHTRVTGSLPR